MSTIGKIYQIGVNCISNKMGTIHYEKSIVFDFHQFSVDQFKKLSQDEVDIGALKAMKDCICLRCENKVVFIEPNTGHFTGLIPGAYKIFERI